MKFEKGFISPYFITNTDKMEVSYDNPYILLTDKKITLVHGALGGEISDFLQGAESAEQALADVEAAYTTAAKEKGFLK